MCRNPRGATPIACMVVALLAVVGTTGLAAPLAASPERPTTLHRRIGDTVVVGADERIDGDLYVLARTIVIDGTVTGDLVAHGLTITLNGVVDGDLTGCGDSIVINGMVGDDLRTAGVLLTLGSRARIADSASAASLSLVAEPGSSIGGDLLHAGYRAELVGDIGGDASVEAVRVEMRGTVLGTVDLPGPDASWRGAAEPDGVGLGAGIGHRLRRLVVLMLVGLVLTRIAAGGELRRPFRKLGYGTVAVLGVVGVGLLILTATSLVGAALGSLLAQWGLAALVIGLGVATVAVLVGGVGAIAFLAAPVIVGAALGRMLLRATRLHRDNAWALPLLAGLTVIELISIIPWIGALTGTAVTLIGLGAIWSDSRA